MARSLDPEGARDKPMSPAIMRVSAAMLAEVRAKLAVLLGLS